MDKVEQFYELVKEEQTLLIATAAGGSVTMRSVSPVLHKKAILIFTCEFSRKYAQLAANPACCVAVGGFFAEAEAEFLGETMLESNAALRDAYSAKFPDAFVEGVEFGGRQAEFILLKPTKLTGWAPESDNEGAPFAPFEIDLQ